MSIHSPPCQLDVKGRNFVGENVWGLNRDIRYYHLFLTDMGLTLFKVLYICIQIGSVRQEYFVMTSVTSAIWVGSVIIILRTGEEEKVKVKETRQEEKRKEDR